MRGRWRSFWAGLLVTFMINEVSRPPSTGDTKCKPRIYSKQERDNTNAGVRFWERLQYENGITLQGKNRIRQDKLGKMSALWLSHFGFLFEVFFLKCGPFLKSLLNCYNTASVFVFFFSSQEACGILAPQPGTGTHKLLWTGRRSLHHWPPEKSQHSHSETEKQLYSENSPRLPHWSPQNTPLQETYMLGA